MFTNVSFRLQEHYNTLSCCILALNSVHFDEKCVVCRHFESSVICVGCEFIIHFVVISSQQRPSMYVKNANFGVCCLQTFSAFFSRVLKWDLAGYWTEPFVLFVT